MRRLRTAATLVTVTALGALALPALAAARPQPPARAAGAVPRELIVRFKRAADAGERSALRVKAGVGVKRALPVPGLQLVRVEPGQSTRQAADRLSRSPKVAYAEPNFYRRAEFAPNDPYLGYLWGLADIDAPEAWDYTTGSSAVTAAVIDTGVDYTHPDLSSHVWTNPGETGGGRESNGRDDDGDGLVDDWRGWDWASGDNSPSDENGHGTHVAGTIAAAGNDGHGVAGVSWKTRVMPLRVLDASGSGSVADLLSAYRYAASKGARVINLSLGGSDFSQAELDAIAAAPNTLFVVAAGNGGADGLGDDDDTTPEFPCAYNLPNIVCVAASDRSDGLASFSNYGASSVDLAAPGVDILSTQPGDSFAYYSGTSMAAPHVAGVASLVWALQPGSAPAAVKADLLGGVDAKRAFLGKTQSGGRLNALRALRLADPGAKPSPPASATGPKPSGADRRPPVLSLRVRSRQRLRSVLRHGLRLRAGCSEPCTLSLRLLLGARAARRVHLSRAAVVGRGTESVAPSGKRIVIRLSRSARRRLRSARRLRLVVSAVAVDRAGNARRARLAISLRR